MSCRRPLDKRASGIRRRTALALTAAALALSAIALSPAALAGKRTTEVLVHSRYWEVAVSGHTYAVRAGGELARPQCTTVESITPVVKFTVKEGRGPHPYAVHSYAVKMIGPKSAGTSDGFERRFTGRSTEVRYPFIAKMFSKLTESSDAPSFPTGTYSAQLKFGRGARPQTLEKLTVVAGRRC